MTALQPRGDIPPNSYVHSFQTETKLVYQIELNIQFKYMSQYWFRDILQFDNYPVL